MVDRCLSCRARICARLARSQFLGNSISEIKTFSTSSKGQSFSWAVPIMNSQYSANNFKKSGYSYSRYLERSLARQWKISIDSLIAIPLFGTDASQNSLIILMNRYWSEATGHPYKPYSVQLLYPPKESLIKSSDRVSCTL